MSMRLRFWLAALDAICLCGGYGTPLYLWAVGKASDATDWGEPLDAADDGGAS